MGLGVIFAPWSTAAVGGPDDMTFCHATDETGFLDAALTVCWTVSRQASPPSSIARAIARMIESGPIPAVHGVVRWPLIDSRYEMVG
jgi:hypothetical protein